MVLGALIQHWLCYRRFPESRCITLFRSDEQVTLESDAPTTSIGKSAKLADLEIDAGAHWND
jgi:hypothetical protein